jgi:hypothetical protein
MRPILGSPEGPSLGAEGSKEDRTVQKRLALFIPAALLVVGVYILGTALSAGQSIKLFGLHELPTRFGYLLGGVAIFGGAVLLIDTLVGGRPQRRSRAA